VVDEIRRLTELLARDPSSMAFRDLAERLRVRGELDAAQRVALRGLERHTLDAESHALLARICIDRGELQRAFDEWDMALRLSPRHVGALKGLGFISYRWGKLADAERYLRHAIDLAPGDPSLAGALESVRNAQAALARFPSPEITKSEKDTASTNNGAEPTGARAVAAARTAVAPVKTQGAQDVFAGLATEARVQTLLVDRDGLVLAGRFVSADGTDRGADAGAELSGVSDEANRAIKHLRMGEWKSITFESGDAIVAMSRASADSLVVVASDRDTPLGLVRRALERAQGAAEAWLREER
jgi:Flp pilus assembly protein TadD